MKDLKIRILEEELGSYLENSISSGLLVDSFDLWTTTSPTNGETLDTSIQRSLHAFHGDIKISADFSPSLKRPHIKPKTRVILSTKCE